MSAVLVTDGKSTLADSLVSKGGFLNKDKAGSACVLDNNEQEKERGITIYSTGISLEFAVPLSLPLDTDSVVNRLEDQAIVVDAVVTAPEAAPAVDVATMPAPDAGAGTASVTAVPITDDAADVESPTACQLHLGNLPFHSESFVTSEEVVALLATAGVRPESVTLRCKRGFAFLHFATGAAAAAALLAFTQHQPALALQGRVLTLQRRGGTARLRLAELCQARRWRPPMFVRRRRSAGDTDAIAAAAGVWCLT